VLHCRVQTLPEVLQLAMNSTGAGRPVGVYIETKGPAFHSSIGLPLEARLVDALMAGGYGSVAAAPLILQSFEPQVRSEIRALYSVSASCG
jgi:glycerophosphoryl diester phosphodiesterase